MLRILAVLVALAISAAGREAPDMLFEAVPSERSGIHWVHDNLRIYLITMGTFRINDNR